MALAPDEWRLDLMNALSSGVIKSSDEEAFAMISGPGVPSWLLTVIEGLSVGQGPPRLWPLRGRPHFAQVGVLRGGEVARIPSCPVGVLGREERRVGAMMAKVGLYDGE
jgi:hypothetical protein